MRAAIPVAVYTLITERAMYNRTVMLWGLLPKDLYNTAFIVLAAASVQLLVVSLLYVTGRMRSHKAALISSYVYFICCTVVGQSIAVYDYAIGKQVIMFLPMVAWIFALFLVHPIPSTLFAWVSFGIIPEITNTRVVLSNYTERLMLVFAAMLLVISFVRWNAQVRAAEAEEQLKLMNVKLSETSSHDELTGVRNRHALQTDIHELINKPLIVVMSDIDDFKYYNDSFGHDTGDLVLKHMASTLSKTFGKDSVYRFGGDEFLLVLPEWDEADLVTALNEWRNRFRVFESEGNTLHLASTAGYAVGQCESEEQLSQMISLADSMLYEGKMTHKGTTNGAVFEPEKKVTEDLKKLENSLRSGETDTLTKLPNMMYFRSKADLTADILRSSGKKPVLAYFNIDNFKDYNRKYGFEAGDNMLIKLAEYLSAEFENDLVCRFADDRFALITTKDNIEERISNISAKFLELAPDSRIGLRAGLYELLDDSVDVSLACDCAQQAMNGMRRSVCAWYDEEMRKRIELKQYIADHIDEALEKGWIENLYQPVIRSVNRMVCGMEVLPRWNDPVHGILEPELYVPVLEESHSIPAHDYYVLKTACRDFNEYRKRGFPVIPIVINLSYRDLDQDGIVEKIDELTSGIDRNMVNFDISAASLTYLNHHIEATLRQLGERGYHVWMDGFGRNNSTVDILFHHLITGIKLDIRSIHSIGSGKVHRIFLDHIVNMCKEMNIATLALGVENEEEAQFLSELGCEYMQGFWFSDNLTFEECCSDKFLKGFKVEPAEKREYYAAMSRVDLSTPARLDYDSRIETVSNDLPAAICELRDGYFSTCISNAAFRNFLKTRNLDSVEAYERLMNDKESYLHDKLLKMAESVVRSNRWETLDIGAGEMSCICSFHTISKDGDDAVSVIGVVVNMKLYQNAV